MNTQISRLNPFREMDQMQKRLSSIWKWEPFRSVNGPADTLTLGGDWSPNVDIVEDEKEFLIKAELPEMKRDQIKVTLEDNVLTVAGERRQDKEEKNKRYHRIECEYGSFARSFTLPTGTQSDKVTAEFTDGVLRVHLPKDAKAASTKSVEIKVN